MNQFEKINAVLAQWNPIDVPASLASDEYANYVPEILKVVNSGVDPFKLLEDIVSHRIGLEYDPSNCTHTEELRMIASKLMATKSDGIGSDQ